MRTSPGKTDVLRTLVGVLITRFTVIRILTAIHSVARVIRTGISIGTTDWLAGTVTTQTEVKLCANAGIVALDHIAVGIVRALSRFAHVFCAFVLVIFTNGASIVVVFTPDRGIA